MSRFLDARSRRLRGAALALLLAGCSSPSGETAGTATTTKELGALRQWQAADLGVVEPQILAQVDGALVALRLAQGDGKSGAELAERLGEVAMLHHLYRRPDRALEAYALAAAAAPRDPRWPYYEALLRRQQGELTATADALRRCLATGTEALAPRIRLAEVLLEQGEVESAHEQLAALAGEHPDSLRARVARAEAELDLGRSAAALAALEELRKELPDSKRIRLARGRALRAEGRPDEARALLGAIGPLTMADRRLDLDDPWVQAMTRLNRSSEAAWNLGRALLQQQRWAEAETALRAAVEREPARPAYWTDLATALARLGQTEKAGEILARALELAPEYLPAMVQLAAAHRRQGADDEALALYDRILALDPHRPAVLLMKADLLQSAGRAADAIEPLESALTLAPGDERALLALALCHFDLGHAEAAAATVSRGLAARPASFWFRSLDLRLCALAPAPCQPDLAQAELLRRARPTAFAAETTAMALAALGDRQAAERWQRTALVSLRDAGAATGLAERRLAAYGGGTPERTAFHRSELAAARAPVAPDLENLGKTPTKGGLEAKEKIP